MCFYSLHLMRTCQCYRRQHDGKPVVKPEFKNAKVASLYDSWQRVVQLSAERRRRLQQMLDHLNEVSCHLTCFVGKYPVADAEQLIRVQWFNSVLKKHGGTHIVVAIRSLPSTKVVPYGEQKCTLTLSLLCYPHHKYCQ